MCAPKYGKEEFVSMSNRKRFLILAVALLVLASSLACICGQCSNPLTQRQQDNKTIVSGVDLGAVVMAKGIGSNNEPISTTSTFSTSEDVIYVVAKANHIDSGTSMYARWSYEGEPFEDTPVITADRDYDNTYVEFHIEPKSIGVLKAGNYTVKIYVNGNPVSTTAFKLQ
jgi:hypothetical protein